ncbi:hypothetical protein HYT57_00365 [Candidatus Woesearchaeota archaeon]|nr:hypothetical protein [Candidatus Woesearchaeota archaeon]
MNKKSIMFTFIAITMLFVILVSFLITVQTSTKSQTDKILAKTTATNAFVESFSVNVESALKASANQAILAIEDKMDIDDAYLNGNRDVIIREAISDGKYRGNDLRMMKFKQPDDTITDFTLSSTLNEFKKVAERGNIILTYDLLDKQTINSAMVSPWSLNVNFQLKNVKVTDKEQEVSWNLGNLDVEATLDITKYRDPIYLVSDDINITVIKTNVTDFESSDNLNYFIDNFQFRNHTDAPDFMQRLFGDFNSISNNGYETILNSGHINPPNTPNPNSDSYVDFLYWGTKAVSPSCSIAGIPAPIKLDSEHKIYYTGDGCPIP